MTYHLDKFVELIEKTGHKARAIKNGEVVKGTEKELQKSIIQYANSLGYKAINEDILRIEIPYHQPLMDVVVEIDGYLHGAELKIMNVEEHTYAFRFFEGLGQALAYSLNGVDYSWLVHYLVEPLPPIPTGRASPLERIFQTFGIKQIGYLLVDPVGLKRTLKPAEPIKYDAQSAEIRKKIERMLRLAR